MFDKISDYLHRTEDGYNLNTSPILVEFEYSKNGKSFEECMLNILKQKYNK